MKIKFDFFKFKNEYYKQLSGKKWGHLSSFMFPSWVMVLKLSKKVHILNFCANLSKKPESVEAIYIYASESSHYTSKSKILNHQKFNKNSSTSEPNISETVRRSVKNNTIF